MKYHLAIIYALVSVILAGLGAIFYDVNASLNGDVDVRTKSTLHNVIKQALLDEPEILRVAGEKLNKQYRAEQKEEVRKKVKTYMSNISASKRIPRLGNGENLIVEFLDYNCRVCKQMLSTKNRLLDDGDFSIFVIDYPFLAQSSLLAAHASAAVYELAPNLYREFHNAILGHAEQPDEKFIASLVTKLGLDANKVKEKMYSKEIDAQIRENHMLGAQLEIDGTPAYIINDDEVKYGVLNYNDIKQMVEDSSAQTSDIPK